MLLSYAHLIYSSLCQVDVNTEITQLILMFLKQRFQQFPIFTLTLILAAHEGVIINNLCDFCSFLYTFLLFLCFCIAMCLSICNCVLYVLFDSYVCVVMLVFCAIACVYVSRVV